MHYITISTLCLLVGLLYGVGDFGKNILKVQTISLDWSNAIMKSKHVSLSFEVIVEVFKQVHTSVDI